MTKTRKSSNGAKRPTLQDVAKLAGVSTAVVSYVINDGPRPTSDEMKLRVNKAIKDLNYHPNAYARGLRLKRTKTIGLITYDFSPMSVYMSSYSAGILTGLTGRLREKGYFNLVSPMTIGEDLRPLEELLQSERLDGIVVRPIQAPPATDALLERIAASHIPCVCIERPGADRFGFSAVTYDDRRGAYDATEYLLSQGHRRIGYIRGDTRFVTVHERFAGYQNALRHHRVRYSEEFVWGEDWSDSTTRAGVDHLLSLPEPPTAIFAASDGMAFVVINQLRKRHISVPEEVAVVGFDDIEMASLFVPSLSTVHVPLLEIGQLAADLIIEQVETNPEVPPSTHVLPVQFIRRESA
jgi:DNA-binding LacI/PurR family transcriptional regulator